MERKQRMAIKLDLCQVGHDRAEFLAGMSVRACDYRADVDGAVLRAWWPHIPLSPCIRHAYVVDSFVMSASATQHLTSASDSGSIPQARKPGESPGPCT